ncbi:Uncharacterised protein (plasmid) [Tsukamurella tyrosinosolvens]|uniref:Uncharacterized protein n=1 Tax=Tsukamurella tyrosinosolvens TaxID=57704 RepID=A0A1H4PG90_TSUTY|nr:hypothetical protein [Tsukamurella tyrosinosolvens]AUN39626.1 hypothetical protein ASU32_06050 [Tsukamurella tyrosinosolvens]KXO97350.1 hypothetical protein AXK58_09025 [Tsukamurella tyrosinosolvens]SEC06415.1 hypothetical protein SAMN04489793_1436 [Tsukamurella tyrosinosolvens]VEH97254.1 Uncharacterised protein [Tsukamurella tyrosinosolvens]
MVRRPSPPTASLPPGAGAASRRWWGHWPAVVGLVAAGIQVAGGVEPAAVSITLAVAASCYLAAAALDRPWAAWAGIPAGSAVVVAGEVSGLPWWAGLSAYALILLLIGVVRDHTARPLAEQCLALLVYGGAAVVAILVSPRGGLALAGSALACHALWDLRHLRRGDVVPRSLAEFCIVLDIPLGAAAIALACTGAAAPTA